MLTSIDSSDERINVVENIKLGRVGNLHSCSSCENLAQGHSSEKHIEGDFRSSEVGQARVKKHSVHESSSRS